MAHPVPPSQKESDPQEEVQTLREKTVSKIKVFFVF